MPSMTFDKLGDFYEMKFSKKRGINNDVYPKMLVEELNKMT